MLGGVAWLALGLSNVLGYLQAIPDREDVVLLIVALLLTAAGLAGLHALQVGRHGLVGQAGFYIAFASLLARALAAYGSALFGLIMVVLGYALLARKVTAAEQHPQRVV